MLVLAMQLAESSRFAEAEAIATRVTAAQPTSGQGWFLLAFARKHQNNREGTAEARRRCTALGGQWANECRAL
jgi:predicted Zn-dependent protease